MQCLLIFDRISSPDTTDLKRRINSREAKFRDMHAFRVSHCSGLHFNLSGEIGCRNVAVGGGWCLNGGSLAEEHYFLGVEPHAAGVGGEGGTRHIRELVQEAVRERRRDGRAREHVPAVRGNGWL